MTLATAGRMTAGTRADAWASDYHAKIAAPALVLAVAGSRGPLWAAAFGSADLELGVPCGPEHRFPIGSVSKALTATAAARLASRGLLELDTPISYWLPDLPPPHRATTLTQLLTHRGGIRHYLPRDFCAAQPGGPPLTRPLWTRAEILAAFIDDDLVARPGERVSYSSWGYALASIVMEAATRQPFLELIDDEIARPFALETLAADQPGGPIPGRVRGYLGDEQRRRLQEQFPEADFPDSVDGWVNSPPVNPAFCWAGGGFLMSVPDLARFGAALIEGPGSRISAVERALLFEPRTPQCESSPPLGLGWRVDHDAKGRLRWHHAGTTPGGRASLVVYPEAGLSIALATNAMMTPGDVLGPSSELADLFA